MRSLIARNEFVPTVLTLRAFEWKRKDNAVEHNHLLHPLVAFAPYRDLFLLPFLVGVVDAGKEAAQSLDRRDNLVWHIAESPP
jgi:hypothetical protein